MYDFIIVGSGVSGGRIALELVESGAKCLLLEAGREFGAGTFPDNEMDYSTQLFWGGGLEVSADGRIGFLRAKCLGGTSIVNQALLDRFDDNAWDDWRDRSGVSWMNVRDMESHYAACESTIKVSEVPRQFWGKNSDVFRKGLEAMGTKWKPLKRAQGDCKLEHGSDCIVCLGGCPRDSKQSSLVTTVRRAREKGLEVWSEFEVVRIEHSRDQVKVVGKGREAVARRVALAAGSFGNTGILLRSGVKLPAVGQSFSCHPQYMTYAMFDEPVDAHKGAFQSVKSDDPVLRKSGFKLENVYAPPIGTSMLIPGFGPEHQKLMRKYRYYASMEVAVRDEPSGRIALDKGERLRVDKKLTDQDRKRSKEGLEFVHGAFAKTGPKQIVSCTQPFGLHLMGGCVLGTDAKTSVVAPDFRIHDYPNLYAADSSTFPAAPGINPSFTVMALSHRAAQSMVKGV